MKFTVINDGEYAVRKAGYKLDLSNNCEKLHLTADWCQKYMDGFFDLDCAKLCDAEDGQLYAVEYAYSKDGFVPAVWCPVVPMSTKDARECAGLTQEKMSDVLDIPKRTIEDWDRGARQCPEWARRLIVEKLMRLTYGD